MNTSDMPSHSALRFTFSTSYTSSNDNARSGLEPMKPLGDKPCKEKQSSEDSNVSGPSSRNGSACGGRSKETLMASGTAASEDLKKLSRLSLRTKGKHKRAVCTLFCEHVDELCFQKYWQII